MKKRILSMTLAAVLLLGMLSASASASGPADVYRYLKEYAMSGESNSDHTVYKKVIDLDDYGEAFFRVEYYTSDGSLVLSYFFHNGGVTMRLTANMSIPYHLRVDTEYGYGEGTLSNPGTYTEKTQLTLDTFVGDNMNQAYDAEKMLTRSFPDLLEYILLVIDGGGYTLKDLRFTKFTRHTVHIYQQGETVVPPTCSANGTAYFRCKICGSQIVMEIPATGLHAWKLTEYIFEDEASPHNSYARYTCDTCGNDKYGRICAGEIFDDMPADDNWAHDPIDWAYFSGITDGVADNLFGLNQACTRAQVVTFLWRAAGEPEPSSAENPFTDVAEGTWYYKPVLWAVEKGITDGLTDTTFGPGQTCTRNQVVTFLWRANGETEPTKTDNPFTDVPEGSWFCKPVLWALENGVTDGVTDTLFGSTQSCTRAQVVTFLYRCRDLGQNTPESTPDPEPAPDPKP